MESEPLALGLALRGLTEYLSQPCDVFLYDPAERWSGPPVCSAYRYYFRLFPSRTPVSGMSVQPSATNRIITDHYLQLKINAVRMLSQRFVIVF